MKILIFLKKWKGGIGVVVNSIKKELEKKGHKVICISREEDLAYYSSIKNLFWLRKKYKNIIDKENPDIIYTQDWSMALPLLFPLRIFKKNHYCCFHGLSEGISGFFQTFVSRTMKNKIIGVGDSIKRKYPKSNLIYNSVDFELFKPNKKIKKIKDSVGFVNWKTNSYHYDEIKKACYELNKKLIIAENIPYNKMPEFYQELECFISVPPKCTGFNLSWLEASACGVKKIIGSDSGIGSKLNINKIKDFKSIKDAIRNCKNNNGNIDIIKNIFDKDRNLNKLLKILK